MKNFAYSITLAVTTTACSNANGKVEFLAWTAYYEDRNGFSRSGSEIKSRLIHRSVKTLDAQTILSPLDSANTLAEAQRVTAAQIFRRK